MKNNKAPFIFKLLSNDVRWNIIKALSQSDLRVQELTGIFRQPQNLISYHLQKLHAAGVVIEHHSFADGREIYYGINLKQINNLFKKAHEDIHPWLTMDQENIFPDPPLRILFLCTHNSSRSQMAEGLLRAKSHQQIEVFSAGTDPMPVNPNAIQVMEELNIDIHSQKSKGQDHYLDQSFDFVITVCDRAREACLVFLGNPIKIHWSITDPTLMTGSLESQLQTFRETAQELDERINFFLSGVSSQAELKDNYEFLR